ncbi:unnamed protein product [Trifolium pratense]|uniref:Uncharacterized protein n=1 Tax=Trifolium pratense TaxID=57577 RepID=A0ACB0KZ24_TRIPR|nr:unnamed protein product [Trifolium pratense]
MQANGSIQQRQLRFARHEKSNKNSLPSSNIGTIFLPQAKARQAHAFPREGSPSRDSNNLIAKQKPGNPTHEGGSYAQIGAYHAIHAQCKPRPAQAKNSMIITKNSLPSSNIGTIFLPQAKARQAHAFPREGHRVGTTTTLLPSKSQAIPPTRVGAMHKYVLTMLSMPNASQGLPKPRTA